MPLRRITGPPAEARPRSRTVRVRGGASVHASGIYAKRISAAPAGRTRGSAQVTVESTRERRPSEIVERRDKATAPFGNNRADPRTVPGVGLARLGETLARCFQAPGANQAAVNLGGSYQKRVTSADSRTPLNLPAARR